MQLVEQAAKLKVSQSPLRSGTRWRIFSFLGQSILFDAPGVTFQEGVNFLKETAGFAITWDVLFVAASNRAAAASKILWHQRSQLDKDASISFIYFSRVHDDSVPCNFS